MSGYNPETWAMSPAERARETRQAYVSKGLCPYCYGARPADPGKEACTSCRLERNRRYNERRRQRLAAGLCGKCRRPLDRDGTLCSACLPRVRGWHRDHQRRKVESGRCGHCGEPVIPGKTLCAECARDNQARTTGRYRAQQDARPTCGHETWRCRIRVIGIERGRVKIRWREWCPACRKSKQMTFLADPTRFEEFVGWHGVTTTGPHEGVAA